MSMYFPNTTDKLQLITGSAAALHVNVSYMDVVSSTLVASGANRQNTAIAAATTTDIMAAPGASTTRAMKQMTVRNKDAALSCDVTVQYNANATLIELHKVTLTPGDCLIFTEGVGFFTLQNSIGAPTGNSNTSDVVTGTGVDTYLSGSSLNISNILQASSHFRWRFVFTKSAAGLVAPTFTVRCGTTGSVADTALCALALTSAQTAVTDTGYCEVDAMIRTFSTTGVVQAALEMQHVNTTTGLASTAQIQIIKTTSGTFDLTASGLILGVSCNPGTSGIFTFQEVSVAGYNLKVR